jgi:hypothetical protein
MRLSFNFFQQALYKLVLIENVYENKYYNFQLRHNYTEIISLQC